MIGIHVTPSIGLAMGCLPCCWFQSCRLTNFILFCLPFTIKNEVEMCFLYKQTLQSRFAGKVFDGVLGPPHLAQHTCWQEARLRALEGRYVSSKSPLTAPRPKLEGCREKRKTKVSSPSHQFALLANGKSFSVTKSKQNK